MVSPSSSSHQQRRKLQFQWWRKFEDRKRRILFHLHLHEIERLVIWLVSWNCESLLGYRCFTFSSCCTKILANKRINSQIRERRSRSLRKRYSRQKSWDRSTESRLLYPFIWWWSTPGPPGKQTAIKSSSVLSNNNNYSNIKTSDRLSLFDAPWMIFMGIRVNPFQDFLIFLSKKLCLLSFHHQLLLQDGH